METNEQWKLMSMGEFITKCTACGGNWGAMLLTGIKEVFPEHYEEVNDCYNGMGFSDGGMRAFCYLCDWLAEHGVYTEE